MAYCTKCGTQWPEGVHFCGKCGVPILSEPDMEPEERISEASQDTSLLDDVASPLKTLGKYVIVGIAILIVFFWRLDNEHA